MLAAQFASRDEAALMKLLFWVVEENAALDKCNSLKTLLEIRSGCGNSPETRQERFLLQSPYTPSSKGR